MIVPIRMEPEKRAWLCCLALLALGTVGVRALTPLSGGHVLLPALRQASDVLSQEATASGLLQVLPRRRSRRRPALRALFFLPCAFAHPVPPPTHTHTMHRHRPRMHSGRR